MRKHAPLEKKARLRETAAAHVATYGLDGFNLHDLAPKAGMKFDIARHHYRTNQALLRDVVRHHQAALGEALADPILTARTLPPPERLHTLIAAILETLIDSGNWHRAAMAILAAYPAIAHETRNTDLWLHDELTQILNNEILARSLLILTGHWALRLGDADPEARKECVSILANLVLAIHEP